MKKLIYPSALRWIWISVLVIILDQITKFIALSFLTYGQALPITSSFNLTLLHNMGAAFSFLNQKGHSASWLFGGFAVFISIVIIIWMKRLPKSDRWVGIALALILGGAVGNLVDRILHGFVIDFIQVYYKQWYWPAFNIADSAICIGAVMLLIEVIWKPKSK